MKCICLSSSIWRRSSSVTLSSSRTAEPLTMPPRESPAIGQVFSYLFKSGLGAFLQEDCSILEKQDLAPNSRVVIQLRLAEKQILERASASGRTKRLHFEKKLEEGAALPRYEESDLALLENTDAKIPIILRKLEEMEEGQDLQLEKSGAVLSGEEEEQEALYGADMEADGQAAQEDAHKTSRKTEVGEGDGSTPALVVG